MEPEIVFSFVRSFCCCGYLLPRILEVFSFALQRPQGPDLLKTRLQLACLHGLSSAVEQRGDFATVRYSQGDVCGLFV